MFIKDGEVFHQIYRGDMTRSALLDKICDAVTVLMRGGEDSEAYKVTERTKKILQIQIDKEN